MRRALVRRRPLEPIPPAFPRAPAFLAMATLAVAAMLALSAPALTAGEKPGAPSPPPPDPALMRAITAWHHGDPARARRLVDSLLAAQPSHFGARVVLGHLLLEAHDRDGARAAFERAVELEPRRPEGHNGLGLVELDEVRSTQRAVLTLRKLVFSNPEKRAIEHFERALELEPRFNDAAINLADLYLHKGSAEGYERALDLLKDRLDPTYRLDDLLSRMGLALLGLGRYGEAENAFLQVTNHSPRNDVANYGLAQIAVETRRPKEATEAYLRATYEISDPDLKERLKDEVAPLLTRDELRQLGEAERKPGGEGLGGFLRRYWKRQDPTPTTVENERLFEHLERVRTARRDYGSSEPRGIDDRGMIFIRYGAPAEKHVSAGTEMAKPNESWAYTGLGSEIVTFDFIDEGGGIFHLSADLGRALSAFSLESSGRLEALLDFFRERESLSPEYARVVGELTLMREGGAGSRAQQVEHTKQLLTDYRETTEHRQEEAPRSRSAASPGKEDLGGQIALARFRGEEKGGRLEIYYGIPVGELRWTPGEIPSAVIEESFAVFDERFDEVAAASRQKAIRIDDPKAPGQAYVGQVNIPLDPNSYQVAFSLREIGSNRSCTFRFRLKMPDFGADSLRLSDLQLGRQTERVGEASRLRPYPFQGVDRKHPLYVHYAIYGLHRAADGLTDFRVVYELERPAGGIVKLLGRLMPFGAGDRAGSAVALDAVRRGSARDADEMVELDLQALDPGEYLLNVRVEDQVGKQVASAQTRIQVMN